MELVRVWVEFRENSQIWELPNFLFWRNWGSHRVQNTQNFAKLLHQSCIRLNNFCNNIESMHVT